MPVRYILLSVWVRLSMLSQLSIIRYMGLCVFSLSISLVMIERILSYYHQIGSMNYYPLWMYASVNRLSIGSDNGVSPLRHQAIIWTNAGWLSIGHLGTRFSDTLIKMKKKLFHWPKCIWKYNLRNGGNFVQVRWVNNGMTYAVWILSRGRQVIVYSALSEPHLLTTSQHDRLFQVWGFPCSRSLI